VVNVTNLGSTPTEITVVINLANADQFSKSFHGPIPKKSVNACRMGISISPHLCYYTTFRNSYFKISTKLLLLPAKLIHFTWNLKAFTWHMPQKYQHDKLIYFIFLQYLKYGMHIMQQRSEHGLMTNSVNFMQQLHHLIITAITPPDKYY